MDQAEEIQRLEDLIDSLQSDDQNRMSLEHPRRKLVVDTDRVVTKKDEKMKSRANWFAIQEE